MCKFSRREGVPLILFLSICLLVTPNGLSVTVPHVPVVQVHTYGCVKIFLHTKRPFNFPRAHAGRAVKWLDWLSFLMSHHGAGLLPTGSKLMNNSVCLVYLDQDWRDWTDYPKKVSWVLDRRYLLGFGLAQGWWDPMVIATHKKPSPVMWQKVREASSITL